MGFTKITTGDMNGKGAMSLPDQPTISASELKRKFDEPAKEVVTPKFNNLIDELEATTSAGNLGAQAPTGRTGATVQGVINSVSSDLATLETNAATAIADAHTHTNKTVIDKFSDPGTGLLYDGSPIAGAVNSVNGKTGTVVLTASDVSALPSSTTIPTKVSDLTNDSGYQTASDVSTAIAGKEDKSNLKDLAYIAKDGLSSTKYLQGDGTWQTFPTVTADAYKTIVSGGTSFVASGADTFKINAGSNVTITPLTSPDKGISISATGGGSSTGDMLMSQYDQSGDVKAASSTGNGIKDFVATEIGKLDVSDTAVSGQYVSAVSEIDGKISVSRASLPTITDTYSGTSSDGMSGKAVKSAIDALDVSDSAVSGQYVSAVSETDGKISVTRASLPSVPTITDTYSSTSHDGMSGVAVASAISGKADASALDDWVGTATVASGSVTFTGVNDSGNYGYKLFCNITSSSTNLNPSAQLSSISGEGTSSMSVTYTTDADNGATCKLRRIK